MKTEMKTGIATETLLTKIPPDHVKLYFHFYTGMKEVIADCKRLVLERPGVHGPGSAAFREYLGILQALNRLVKTNWIQETTQVSVVKSLLQDLLFAGVRAYQEGDCSVENLTFNKSMGYFYGSVLRSKKGRPRDIAFDFLISALTNDLRHYTKFPQYRLVCDFLDEQGINPFDLRDDVKLDENDIRKRVKSINRDYIFRQISLCRSIYPKRFLFPEGVARIDVESFFGRFYSIYLKPFSKSPS